jgi:hypothetical protein
MEGTMSSFRELVRALAGLTAALLFPAFAAEAPPHPARNWQEYPAVVSATTTEDIYAIGDAHGDFEHLERVMKAAGIIAEITPGPETARWSAGKAVLVTTGDMIDKGPRASDVIRLLRNLREQAAAAGGCVIILAGNHEAEFLANPAAPKGKDFAAQMKSLHTEPADVAQCKGEFGEFLCSLSFGARVDKWYFSHAGYTQGMSLDQIEAFVEGAFGAHGYAAKELVAPDSLMRADLARKEDGATPWIDWKMPGKSEKEVLEQNTRALGVEHIVQGHVPSDVVFADGVVRNHGEMFQRYGKLFLIDTGMSRGVDDSDGAALYLPHGGEKAIAVCADGTRTLLWDEKTGQDVGRAHACGR